MARENTHLRNLDSVTFKEQRMPEEFKQFVRLHILPKISIAGYKRAPKEELLGHLAHNLILTGLRSQCVADSRDRTIAGVRLRVDLWDALIRAGFAKICIGSELARKTTRYRATTALLDLRKSWELGQLVDLSLKRGTETTTASQYAPVLLHSGRFDAITGMALSKELRKQPIPMAIAIEQGAQPGPDGHPDPRAIVNGMNAVRRLEDEIERINRSNLMHTWQAFSRDPETGREYVFQPNPCLRLIYSGQLFECGRLYSWSHLSGQNLSKHQRKSIRIDGEPVAELDFSGMATRMLYHLRVGRGPKGDIYLPSKIMPQFYALNATTSKEKAIVRSFIKRATNVCWNVDSEASARASVGKLLAKHRERAYLQKVVYRIEDSSPADVVARIQLAHPDLEAQFFTQAGRRLMTIDGMIMKFALLLFAEAGKPALGIHDSIVSKVSDVDFARQAMTLAYREFLPFPPVIKRAY